MSFVGAAGLNNYAVTEQRFWLKTAENVKLYYICTTEKDSNFIEKSRINPEIISRTWNSQPSVMSQLQTLLCNPWLLNEFEVMY